MPMRPLEDAQTYLRGVQDEMNRLFERVWHGGLSTRPFDGQSWAPPIDVMEFEDRYVVFAEVPGVALSDVDISELGGRITIRGQKRAPGELEAGPPALQGERRFGAFCRTLDFPSAVDTTGVTASCKDGVLQITVPKNESAKAKTVRVDLK